MSPQTLRPACIAAAYLVAATALIAAIGSELAGPSASERAAKAEERQRQSLALLADAASAVASRHLREETLRTKERSRVLEATLAAVSQWAASGPIKADRLEDVVPDGVLAGIYSSDGTPLAEFGEASPKTRPDALGEVLANGLTVLVAWADGPGRTLQDLGMELTSLCPPGVAIRVLDREGRTVCETSTHSRGSEGGKLISASATVPESGWTVLAERLLTPEALEVGPSRGLGAAALAGLGVLAAAAFVHATKASAAKATLSIQTPQAPRPQLVRQAERTAEPPAQAITFEPGRSVLKLREALGGPTEGPDLAAYARSPLLRALSRQLRSGGPGVSPKNLRREAA